MPLPDVWRLLLLSGYITHTFFNILRNIEINLYISDCLAGPASIFSELFNSFGLTLGTGCRVGWAKDIRRRYLTFIFCHQTWQFEFYRKKRQWERPQVVTIRSSAPERWRGVNCISSLTWASCLAYLCRRQPRLDDRVSKSCTPTSFFCTRSGRGVPDQDD